MTKPTLSQTVGPFTVQIWPDESLIVLKDGAPSYAGELYGATLIRALTREIAALRTATDHSSTLKVYEGTDGRREWASVNTWIYPGDSIILVSPPESA